jgi:hypothetical protein
MHAIRTGKAGDSIISFYPTRAYQGRPSFMELEMSEKLLSGFRDSVLFLVDGSPNRVVVGQIVDATITALEFMHAFAPSSPSTIGERYFGLQRQSRQGRSLSTIQRLVTVVEAILVPYLLRQDLTAKKFRFFRLLKIFVSLMYLTNMTDYKSPLGWMFGIKIVRRGLEERIPSRVVSAQSILFTVIWGLVYGVQFLQWYYSHEHILNHRSSDVCRPVHFPKTRYTGLPADPSLCPICRRTRTNPTALVATGHVYCYACIWNWLNQSGSICPITAKSLPPVSEKLNLLRRLGGVGAN